jgi:hypothetical protein
MEIKAFAYIQILSANMERKDLFGNKIKKDIDPAEQELTNYDNETFKKRLKRLKYVNKIYPFGEKIFGSDESFRIFHESIQSYVSGQFIAAIILSQAFIERRFQEYFHIGLDDKKSKYTLSKLLKEFKETGYIDDYFIEKIDQIRLKRNPFIHHKEPLHKDTLMARSFEAKINPNDLLENDAKEALRMMLIMIKMRVL